MCFEQFIQSGKILKAGYLSSEKASLVSGGGDARCSVWFGFLKERLIYEDEIH